MNVNVNHENNAASANRDVTDDSEVNDLLREVAGEAFRAATGGELLNVGDRKNITVAIAVEVKEPEVEEQ